VRSGTSQASAPTTFARPVATSTVQMRRWVSWNEMYFPFGDQAGV
jgi:hypothetical protein